MVRNRGLVLAHLWLAFLVFGLAIVLGAWQMWVRSPLSAPFSARRSIFHIGHGARHRDGVCPDHVFHHGIWLFRGRDSARPRTSRASRQPGLPTDLA